MTRKFLCLLLAAVLVLGLLPAAMAVTDSKGRRAECLEDYHHAYVVQGDLLKVKFHYDTQSHPCASPVWLYKADLTGKETQAELDKLAYKLLTGSKDPLYYNPGPTHSVSSNTQYAYLETGDLKTGTYLIVAAAMSDRSYIGKKDIIHYETATGVGMHVVSEAVPIETCEIWSCDASGKELKKLSADEAFTIYYEQEKRNCRFKVKTYPENATERVTRLFASAEEFNAPPYMVPGFSFEDGFYQSYPQTCGSGYFFVEVDSFGDSEDASILRTDLTFQIPCHPEGPVKVQQWYTCTEPGFKCAYCFGYGDSCETVFGYEVMDPPGHQLTEIYEIVTEPTATQPGVAKGLCKNCRSTWVKGKIPAIFTDTQPDAFYSQALDHGYAAGWVSGLSANTFGPNAECNRAQVVTFLWRAAGSPEPAVTENPFVDVQAGSFYEKAVLWAVEMGITNGADATHFNPMGICNRAQVVTFLHRAFGSPALENGENPFADVPADTWYTAPVLWAVEMGITNGMGQGLFGVNNPCNRAQIVTFLYRAYTE